MTRRANGEGTAPYPYRRGGTAWAAQLTVRTPDGRSRRVTVYGPTRQACLAKRKAKERESFAGPVASRRPPRITEFGEAWIGGNLTVAVATGNLSATTRAKYRDSWDRHIKPDLGHLRLDELTPPVLRAWLLRKATEPSARGKVLAPRSQQIIYGVLRRALNDAVRDGLIATSPMSKVQAPRGGSRLADPLTVEEATSLLASTIDDPLYALWVTLIGVGLRIGEALALRWEDVDLSDGVVSVSRTVARLRGDYDPSVGRHRTSLIVKAPKTAASAAKVALPTFVVNALRQHRTRQTTERLASRHWQENDLVFPSPIGTLLDSRNVLRDFKSACEIAGITRNVRVHDCRHTAASFLLAAKVDLRVVQSVLRHTRLATTADVYAHVLDEVKREAAEAMDQVLEGIAPSRAEVQ